MTPPADGEQKASQPFSSRFLQAFSRPQPGAGGAPAVPDEIIPPEGRKAAMTGLDDREVKWALSGMILATVAGIAIPAYIIVTNKVTKAGKNTIAVAPDAKLLGGLLLVLCAIGFVTLWKRRRTFLAFDFFLIGFGFTLFIGLVGFAFIFLGAWLLLRAYRINKYGTANAKAVARQAATRPRGRDRKEARTRGAAAASAKTSTSGTAKPTAPKANKRYTPKAPPRKKVPKPVE
jgi:hypothetical protein